MSVAEQLVQHPAGCRCPGHACWLPLLVKTSLSVLTAATKRSLCAKQGVTLCRAARTPTVPSLIYLDRLHTELSVLQLNNRCAREAQSVSGIHGIQHATLRRDGRLITVNLGHRKRGVCVKIRGQIRHGFAPLQPLANQPSHPCPATTGIGASHTPSSNILILPPSVTALAVVDGGV